MHGQVHGRARQNLEAPDGPIDIPARRRAFNGYAQKEIESADKSTLIGIEIEERRIPVVKPEGEISIRIYTPAATSDGSGLGETFPAYVDIHGGGSCIGDLDTDEMKCRSICKTHRAVVMNVDYRLAPEFPWPIGTDDSFETLKWVANHASEIRADLKKGFIVNGNSAGAFITCIIAQRARVDPDLKGKLTGQVLQVPKTIQPKPEGYPERFRNKLLSFEQNKNDPVLTDETLKTFYEAHKTGPQENPEVSPLLAETLAGLPATYMQIAGADRLRDDGLCYAQRLEEDGVPVKFEVYPGVPHGFSDIFPHLEISKKWREDLDRGIKWLLERQNLPHAG